MTPNYEEKTFESYFNNELDRRSKIYFPFGQVQEGRIGADAASLCDDAWLWARLGFVRRFGGVPLATIAAEMERFLAREVSELPAIHANLLLQYKRPEYITVKAGAEWVHWRKPYFRYSVYAQQHTMLAHLHATFGAQALITYASPALANVNELVYAKMSGKIIESTNFTLAADLTGHQRNTYTKAGTHSVACSEPRRLERLDLLERLRSPKRNQGGSNQALIVEFADGVRTAITASPTFSSAFSRLLSSYSDQGVEEFPLLFSMIIMSVFRDLTGAQWLVSLGGGGEQ